MLEGNWGWLEVLRQAELGDEISIWQGHWTKGGKLVFRGAFMESDLGTLLIEGTFYGGKSGWEGYEARIRHQDVPHLGGSIYLLKHWVGPGAVISVMENDRIYYHTKFDASKFDWVGAAFDVGGIIADSVSGIGGRSVNAAEIAVKANKIGFALDVASFIRTGVASMPEGLSEDEKIDLFLDAAGLGIPIVPDALSLIFNIHWATYQTP